MVSRERTTGHREQITKGGLQKNMCVFKFKEFIFITLFIVSLCSQAAAYTDTKSSGGITVAAEGAVVQKMAGGLAVVKMVAPSISIKISNYNSVDKNVQLKLTNISPKKYKAEPENIKITEKGTRYVTYSLAIKAGGTKEISIFPALKNPDKFTFAVIGDSRTGSYTLKPIVHQKILREVAKSDAVFAISVGDIVNDPTPAGYDYFLKEISGFPLPHFSVPGNHDTDGVQGRDNYLTYIGPVNYSFSLGKFNFILLDNSNGTLYDSQLSFLENELTKNKNNIVFMHKPPFCPVEKLKAHVMDSNYVIKYFMDLMKKYKVRMVFSGHVHGYAHSRVNGTEYIITACAGSFPYMLPTEGGYYNYVLVSVDGDRASVKVYRL